MRRCRLGGLDFATVEKFEGKDKALRVTPRSIKSTKDILATSMFARFTSTLTHKHGIPLPGQQGGAPPTEIGLWVNGNSSWGRVTFVLEDASGQQWVSSDSSPIDFDGWRYVAVSLPGQYPGPENHHWPKSNRWHSDKDGLVHYPLTLQNFGVELPEKVLHVKTFSPAPRPEIYLKDLTVAQGDTVMLKKTVGERD